MDFWPEFLASSRGKEFVAGGFGGAAGVISGYPLDTLRIHLQQPSNSTRSAIGLLHHIVASEGASALYRGMGAPLASVTFQNAFAFQTYAILSRAFDSSSTSNIDPPNPPAYKSVALAGFGTGALQCLLLSPVELVKIRLQLQETTGRSNNHRRNDHLKSPSSMAKYIFKSQGLRGIYRGFTITALRDAPAHGVYFWTYEYTREQLHPGCRKSGQENLQTMLVAGGLAGVASWVCCYPLDVIKTRLQAQVESPWDHPPPKYHGIIDCFRKSVQEEGFRVLWRGLGTAVARAFVVNGTIFAAYEVSLRCLFTNNNHGSIEAEENKRLWEKPV